LAGCRVRDDDDRLSGELVGGVLARDPRDELSRGRLARVDLQHEQPVGVRVRLRLDHARDAQVERAQGVRRLFHLAVLARGPGRIAGSLRHARKAT
jgi:hypothetical protein